MASYKTYFLTILFSAIYFLTYAQEYKPFPGAAFELGKGIDLQKVDEAKIFKIFKNAEPIWENPNGTVATNVYQDVILNEEELDKSLGIDIDLSARFMGSSLDAASSLNRREILNSNSLTLLFSANSDFGKQTLGNLSFDNLAEDPKTLLSERKYRDFVQRYGNYFVYSVRRTSSINIFLTLTSISKEKKETIAAQVKGGYSTGMNSVTAHIDLNNEIYEASKNGRIRINLQSNGDSSGFSGLRDLIKDALDQSNPSLTIANTLRNYIEQFSRENSTITSYYLTPMVNLGVPAEYITWNEAIDDRIIALSKKYRLLQERKQEYQSLIVDPIFISLSNEQEKASLVSSIEQIDRDMFYLLQQKEKCLFECIDSSDIYDCCQYTFKYFKDNDIYNKFHFYKTLFNKIYNNHNLLGKLDTLNLIDLKIDELASKKIKVTFKYAFALKETPENYPWSPFLNVKFKLIVNDKSFDFFFSGKSIISGIPATKDENGIWIPDPANGGLSIAQTEPVLIDSSELKISLVIDDYISGVLNSNVQITPDKMLLRLFQKHNIQIELVD